MAGFVYFVEGSLKAVDHTMLESWGLGYAFDSKTTIQVRESAGETPLDVGGLFFADEPRIGENRVPGYYSTLQEWRELPVIAGRPRIAIGYWRDAKPTPRDLQRDDLLDGLMITLSDDNRWQVPSVRCYDEQAQEWRSELPAYMDFDSTGQVVRGKPIEKYAPLWDATAAIGSELFESEQANRPHNLTDQQMVDAGVALLAANYVVSFPELVVLNALADNGSLALVITAACRKAQLLSWLDTLQKKAPLRTRLVSLQPV